VKRGVLAEAVRKGDTSFLVENDDGFAVGDWIFISNNRKDTWTILEKKSKGQDTPAHLNGSRDVLVKAQIARITEIEENRITIDRELDSDYVAEAVIGDHVGARNIRIHDLSIINHSGKGHAIVFEQPFNAHFRGLTIETTEGAGGIRLVHYAFRCTIEKCDITNSGQYAITISNFSSENVVEGNDITFVEGGDCAILVMMYSKNNVVSENSVDCLSTAAKNDGGIYIHATSFGNRVLNNEIKGASSAIGAFYGANNNVFKGNTGSNPNTGISLWYAGGSNVFEDNDFRFGDTRRPGRHIGVYAYCSQTSVVEENLFSGKLDVGCLAGPKANCSIKNTKPNAYTITSTGLGFEGGISLNRNTFKSVTETFAEYRLE
ncbi:MAG: right-handed parallel beta-helix repeat-containing protein, partial [Lentisphaerae bacterium]|nr:right-handed parallel beta-helix repeat-containing protein [Lentisphaerota bacterium]